MSISKKVNKYKKDILKRIKKYKKDIRNKKNRKKVVAVAVLIIVIPVLYLTRSIFLVAIVNNSPISRLSIMLELEKQGGAQVLDSIITKKLISQEARKKGVQITQVVIDEEIEKVRQTVDAQGMTLENALEMQGQTMDLFIENIKLQKTVEEILGGEINIEDGEIGEYFAKNSQFFEEGATLADVKEQIRDSLFNEKLSTAYQAWIADLREGANIKYIVEY